MGKTMQNVECIMHNGGKRRSVLDYKLTLIISFPFFVLTLISAKLYKSSPQDKTMQNVECIMHNEGKRRSVLDYKLTLIISFPFFVLTLISAKLYKSSPQDFRYSTLCILHYALKSFAFCKLFALHSDNRRKEN